MENKNNIIETVDTSEYSLEKFLRRQALLNSGLNLVKIRDKSTITDQFSRKYIMEWLKNPISNEKRLRDASRTAYRVSQQYRELMQYKASLPLWMHELVPVSGDYGTSAKAKKLMRKEFYEYSEYIERMNLPHEMAKALLIALVDGVFYGAIWDTGDAFFIQPISPDICRLSSILDGTFVFQVNMSTIQEKDLDMYPPQFTQMWHRYHDDKEDRWQDVPPEICFVLKADESVWNYSLPPFVSSLPLVADLENYTELNAAEAELAMYKMIAMTVPLDASKKPTLSFAEVEKYYNQVANNIPEDIGLIATPFDYETITFNESTAPSVVDKITTATNRFWQGSCVNSLLFGDATNKSATALKLSVLKDEQIIFMNMKQAARVVNRLLKYKFGDRKIRYMINFLPVTWMNQEDKVKMYREAATYGMPVKMAYAAALGVAPENFEARNILELGVFDLANELVPVKSSATTSSDAGRPSSEDTGSMPSEKTEQNRESE